MAVREFRFPRDFAGREVRSEADFAGFLFASRATFANTEHLIGDEGSFGDVE